MRVCLVSHLNDLSGANRSLLDLSIELIRLGISVTVIIPRSGELEIALKKNDIDYRKIYSGVWAGVQGKENILKRIFKQAINVIAEYRFYKYVVNEKFDIVHYNSISYGVGARLLYNNHRPYVWHLREFPDELNLRFYNEKTAYKLVNNAKKIFAISKAVYNHYSSIFDSSKIELVYNGLPAYAISQFYERKLSFPQEVTMLIVGAVYPSKGQLEAVQAVEYLYRRGITDIKLQIVGQILDNDYMSCIERYIETHSMQKVIEFCGYQSDVTDFRRNSDIALVCSSSEAFGRVTIEAMLNKQIVIGSNVGGTVELVKDGITGFLYRQGDVVDLANRILYIINNRAACKKITEEAFNSAIQNFSIRNTALKIVNVYETVLKA